MARFNIERDIPDMGVTSRLSMLNDLDVVDPPLGISN